MSESEVVMGCESEVVMVMGCESESEVVTGDVSLVRPHPLGHEWEGQQG